MIEPVTARVPSQPSDLWDKWTWARLFEHLKNIRGILLDDEVLAEKLGILPAVYFPSLRMGSILAADWEAGSREYILSAPEGPPHVPPPYSCFVPETDVPNVALITKIAQVYDRIRRGEPVPDDANLTYCKPLGAWIGTTPWWRLSTAFVIDVHLLHQMRFSSMTVIYILPEQHHPVTYIPLLYLESHDEFSATAMRDRVHALASVAEAEDGALPTNSEAPEAVDNTLPGNAEATRMKIHQGAPMFRDALTSLAHATRLRAREWLHPKTLLLSQAGLNAVRRDLLFRMRDREEFAACFFDIDGFKALNDEIGYTAADNVAKQLARRVKTKIQEILSDDLKPFLDAAAQYPAGTSFPKAFEPPTTGEQPSGFMAFVAHVSGDEFKFFIRVNPAPRLLEPLKEKEPTVSGETDAQSSFPEVRQRLEAIVKAAREELPERDVDERQRQPATVSLGSALIVPSLSPADGIDEKTLIRSIGSAITSADTLAERALEGAKNRGRNRHFMYDDLLFGGGIIVEPLEDQVRLSVGALDGVHREQEFDVFRRSVALKQRLVVEDRRYWREPHQWLARVRVHQVWPRESVAYVVTAGGSKMTKGDWVWLAGTVGNN